MKILLATHHLIDFTGSEIFTYEIAKGLININQEVYVYSPYIFQLQSNFEKLNVPISNSLSTFKDVDFDIAHVHHNIIAYEVRYRFPTLPIVFLAHGIKPFLEQPPNFKTNINQYLAVSQQVKKNLIKKGVSQSIKIFNNIVDEKKFHPFNEINDRPQNALILSARLPRHEEVIIVNTLNMLGIEHKFLGGRFGHVSNDKLPSEINRADIVFSLGRGVIEAMLCGRIPIIFDYQGADGIVTPENYSKLKSVNFNGTYYGEKYTEKQLSDQIKKYKKSDGIKLFKQATDDFSVSNQVDKLISIYNEVLKKNKNNILKSKNNLRHIQNIITETRNYSIYREHKFLLGEQKKVISKLENDLKKMKSSRTYKLSLKIHKMIYWIKYYSKKIIKFSKVFFKNPINGMSLLSEKLKKGIFINHHYKIKNIAEFNNKYQLWLNKNTPTQAELKKQIYESKRFDYQPKISLIIPTYNTPLNLIKKTISSVEKQTYKNWEICIVDDNSNNEDLKDYLTNLIDKKQIKVKFLKKNVGIGKASNVGLNLANGEFIALLDHDDIIYQHALFSIVNALNLNKNLDFIYSDEDKLSLDNKRIEPFFKPDWSPNLLLSFNYITHFAVVRKKLITKLGGFAEELDGSQDYDLFLKVSERTQNILHIPDILYSWRKIPGSTAERYHAKGYANSAAKIALQNACLRRNISANIEDGIVEGTFRTKYKLIRKELISIIIPTKNMYKYISRLINSITSKSTYNNFEIILIDTGTTDLETLKYYEELKSNDKIKFFTWNKPFNYSAVNNFAVTKAKGKYLIFLNNDTEIISSDWMESMLEHAQRDEIGAVGAKLLYPDNTIQHAGIILGIRGPNSNIGIAGHNLKNFKDIPTGLAQWNMKDVVREVSAVTAACLMINKEKFREVGGFEEEFRIAFNDVDLNLKLLKKGYLNIYTPYAKLLHYESLSVGDPSKGNRDLKEFDKEIKMMHKKWADKLQNDCYYNKNLDLTHEDSSPTDLSLK